MALLVPELRMSGFRVVAWSGPALRDPVLPPLSAICPHLWEVLAGPRDTIRGPSQSTKQSQRVRVRTQDSRFGRALICEQGQGPFLGHRRAWGRPDWVQWVASEKKSEPDKCWQRCEKPEPSCFAGGNVKGCSHCGKQRTGGGVLEKSDGITTRSSHSRVNTPQKRKQRLEQMFARPRALQHYSQQPKGEASLGAGGGRTQGDTCIRRTETRA